MELIGKILISALLIGQMGLVIYEQYNDLKAARSRIAQVEKESHDRADALKTMMETATRKQKAAAKLEAERDSIAATLTERENLIESLRHDNPEIRTWADTALPDAIARLREHPAATGADNVGQRLSSGDPLPTAGDRAQD